CRTDDAVITTDQLRTQLIERRSDPRHGLYQDFTTVISLPPQKVQRELKFRRWDGTPIKIARTRQKVSIGNFGQD
ncbi:MAG: hypothetical protein QF773_08965, partial [Lentisphaeria bacterium]|nr:hypothetical protein [Lentisphaeria bacterium]